MSGRCNMLISCFVALLTLGGCNAGRISDENSRLRRDNLDLTEKSEAQKAQLVRLNGQISALMAKLNRPSPAVVGVKPSDIPMATRITLGRYSGAFDEDGDGKVDTVRLYILTEDQQGRFIPVAGKAVLQVVLIEANEPVREVGRKEYAPNEWNDAYISGITGTHYVLEAQFDASIVVPGRRVTAKISLVDAATGATLTDQIAIELSEKK